MAGNGGEKTKPEANRQPEDQRKNNQPRIDADRWTAVRTAAVPILIGGGGGGWLVVLLLIYARQLPDPWDFRLSTLAILLLVGGGWMRVDETHPHKRLRTVPVFVIIGSGALLLQVWIGDALKPAPFNASVRSAQIFDVDSLYCPNMVTYQSMYGPTASPVVYLMYVQIVNSQKIPSTVDQYTVEVSKTADGPWEPLVPISLVENQLYALGVSGTGSGNIVIPLGGYRFGTAMKPDDMKHAALLDPVPKLDSQLGQPIQPNQTITGWVAFDSPPKKTGIIPCFFRITITDSVHVFGSVVVPCPIGKKTEMDVQRGLIHATGVNRDLSGDHLRHYSDPYPQPPPRS